MGNDPNQKAADALAIVAWWFGGPGDPYCKHEQIDGVCHAFFRAKREEMLEKVSAALDELKAQGIVPADPNPF